MKGEKQKISKDTCRQKNRAEPEGYAEGQTFMWITENDITNTDPSDYDMLEHILSPANLNRAINGCGVTKERVELSRWKSNHWATTLLRIRMI